MPEIRKPGETYIYGLANIAKRNGVTLEKALKIAEQDLLNIGGTEEHLDPLRRAFEWLTQNSQPTQEP